MKRLAARLAVAFGATLGLLGLNQSAVMAADHVAERIGANHSEPER